MRNGEVILHF